MRIVRLNAENFKRLVAVEIAPDGNVVQIRGKNGAGKSSILDAISAALGGKTEAPSQPIRRGAEQARIRLDLGDIIVTRRFRQNGATDLVLEAASGARYPSPQHMLDRLIGHISFDPLEFARMKPADQLAELRKLVPLAIDVDALDGLNKRDYEERTEINREVARLRAQATAIQYPDDLPAEPLDIEAIERRHSEAVALQSNWVQGRAEREIVSARIRDMTSRADTFEADLPAMVAERRARISEVDAEYKERIATAERALATLRTQHTSAIENYERELASTIETQNTAIVALRTTAADEQRDLDANPLPAEPPSGGELLIEMHRARGINDAIRERQRRETIEAEAKALELRAAELTTAMAERTRQKREAIAGAKMPVAELGFGEGEVTFNGLPFDQASQSEKIRVSAAIAMAANPTLRVICVKDGSLLDHNALAALAELVRSNDYQLWIERVGDDHVGIVIEDGEVAAVHPTPEAQPSLI